MMTSTLQIQMDNARTFIHHNYQRMPSLHRLALLVGTNECTLKKCFKQSFGTTVFGYLFNLRMEMAVQLLCNTDEPVSTIWVTSTKATSALPSSANMAYRHRCFATSKTRPLQVHDSQKDSALFCKFIEFGQQSH